MKMRRQTGIALLQILFLSIVISTLLLAARYQAQQQLALAFAVKDRTTAELTLESAQAELLFQLLTHERQRDSASLNPVVRDWNFHSGPWKLLGVTIELQDLNGLAQPANVALAEHWFKQQGINAADAERLSRLLQQTTRANAAVPMYQLSAIGVDVNSGRKAPLQLVEELMNYPGLQNIQLDSFIRAFTTFPTQSINPLTMPETLMSYYVPGKLTREQLLKLRAENKLDAVRFSQLTGVSNDEAINFYPGEGLRIVFTAQHNDVKIRRLIEVKLTPYDHDPYTVWEFRKFY